MPGGFVHRPTVDQPAFWTYDMLVLAVVSLALGGTRVRAPARDSGIDTATVVASALPPIPIAPTVMRDTSLSRFAKIAIDTPHTRPKIVEVSDWYSRRLTIHRYVFYATIPVFAVQWAAGKELLDKSRAAPTWAKTFHRVGATALAGMFTVNTVTGAWNWWDSRAVTQGRLLRTIHALTMLGVDAAFTYTGATLSNEAETSEQKRREHVNVALYGIGVTAISGTAMLLWNR